MEGLEERVGPSKPRKDPAGARHWDTTCHETHTWEPGCRCRGWGHGGSVGTSLAAGAHGRSGRSWTVSPAVPGPGLRAPAGRAAGHSCCRAASSCINTATSGDQSILSAALGLATRAGRSSLAAALTRWPPRKPPSLCPHGLNWHLSAKRNHPSLPWRGPPLSVSPSITETSPSLLAPLSRKLPSHEASVPRVSGHVPSAICPVVTS